jgi:hypothetical protein
VSGLIDAERELVQRVHVVDQFVAAVQERRPIHDPLVDFCQQRPIALADEPETMRERSMCVQPRLETKDDVHRESDERERHGGDGGHLGVASREQQVGDGAARGGGKQDGDGDSPRGDEADQPLRRAGVNRVILGDVLRIQTHVIDDGQRKHRHFS